MGRPKKTEQPEKAVKKTKTKAAAEEPSKNDYTVNVKTKLNVRSGAGKENPIVRLINDGDHVTVYEKENNFGRIGDNEWVCLDFLV